MESRLKSLDLRRSHELDLCTVKNRRFVFVERLNSPWKWATCRPHRMSREIERRGETLKINTKLFRAIQRSNILCVVCWFVICKMYIELGERTVHLFYWRSWTMFFDETFAVKTNWDWRHDDKEMNGVSAQTMPLQNSQVADWLAIAMYGLEIMSG
jgi:hypothetical protein